MQVSLTPGDRTIYHLMIVRSCRWIAAEDVPSWMWGAEYGVTLLNHGGGRSIVWRPEPTKEWDLTDLHPLGVTVRRVVAAFLTLFAEALGESHG